MSAVPRHSEEELRQQWAFLDALVDRQAASLKSGSQDPEEEDLPVAAPPPVDGFYMEEISTLTRRVTGLESERTTLLRRIDLAEEARMAAETARASAEAARETAEQALADVRAREVLVPKPVAVAVPEAEPVAAAEPEPVAVAEPEPAALAEMPPVAAPVEPEPAALVQPEPVAVPAAQAEQPQPVASTVAPVRKPPTSKSRRRSWWQRFRE